MKVRVKKYRAVFSENGEITWEEGYYYGSHFTKDIKNRYNGKKLIAIERLGVGRYEVTEIPKFPDINMVEEERNDE